MTQELRTIRLFGHLGKRFGKVHHYAISSPAEAVRAMSCTIPGFRDYVGIEHARSGFRVLVGGEAVGAEQLGEISGGQEIHIVPVVRGAKSALGQILIGAALIAVSFIPGLNVAVWGSGGATWASMIFAAGVGQMLGGIAGLLASPPNPLSYGAGEDNRPSNYLFNGSNQATPSGGPVPVLYGRLEIPLTLISGSITPEQSSYGNSQLGILGDGNGTWSGDGNTVPRAASIRGEATTTTVETAKMMFALSEGPCAGLADGLKSIKFDGTPVQAPDGSFNFKGVSFALVNGTSTQQAIPGFPATETEHSAGGEIKAAQPQYITINDMGTSLVRVKIAFQALQKIDTASGKPVGTSVQIAIDVQASGGSYVEQALAGSGHISDLSSGPTSRAFSVPLSGTGPWTIRVRRITADSTDTYLQNKTYLGSYTEVKDGKLRNPWTAKLAVALNAKEFASIPKITVDYLGRSTVKVPVNYDPATRDCTGVWNGTFKEAWTDNPVWCFFDMATHGRYGAGRYLAAEGLDIWTLYQIAQYCDGMVDNGMGGTEPRYRFNAYFTKDEEAFKVLAHMISVARSQLYYGGSIDRPATALTAIQDVESTPTALFSPSNVIGGRFSYSGTPRKTRYTEVTVWWNDPAQAYKLVPVLVVADPAYVARYGVQSYETVAFGATSKGQAIREGRRILLTNLLEQEIVSFSSGMEGIVAYPGGLVQIQDPGRDQKRQGGRLKEGCTTTSLILDGSVTLAPATAYTAWVTMSDGTVVSRAISTGAGTVSTVAIAALPSSPAAEAQWQVTPTATVPTRWRIIGVKEVRGDEAISYEITAIANAPEKYPLMDQCGTITVVAPETPSVFAPVTDLLATSKTSWSVGSATITLSAKWTMPEAAISAVALVSVENGPWKAMDVAGSSATIDIQSVGECRIRVVAQYRNGASPPTETAITTTEIPTTTPTSLTITKTETRPIVHPDPLTYRDPTDELWAIIHPPIPGEDPNVINPTYLTFAWTHSDANAFALKGFRIVVFTGTDPNDTLSHIRKPYETNAAARGSVVTIHVYEESTINAAIQAIYLDGNESSWRLISGTIAADPDTIAIPTREVINVLDGRVTTALTPSVVADGVTAQFLYTGPTVTCEDWRGVWTLSASPRTNLITYSNTFTGGTWYRSNYPTVTTGIVSPTGASNATKLTAGSTGPYLQQTSPSMPLGFITASIWIKGVGASIGKAGMLWLWEAGTGRAAVQNTKTIFTIPAEWTRISVTANVTTAGTFLFRLDAPDHVATIGDEVCIFNAQLEVGSVATPDIITPGASAVTVTDITVSNGLATLSPAPLKGAILRGLSSNAAGIISAASLDTKITNLERPALRNLRASLAAKVTSAKAKAQAMVPVVPQTALDTAWSTFTANVDPILAATTDSTIVKATFDGWWSSVDSEVTNLHGAMAQQANAKANTAYAATVAAGSDGVLSRGEKPGVIIDYTAAQNDYTTMLARAQNSGLAYADFSAAWETLRDYMVSLSPAYTSTTTDTTINATTWKNAWNGWKSAHTAMLIRIAGAAPSTVDGISTANQNLTTNAAAPVVDGVTQAAGNMVMLAGQTTKSQNGVYQVAYTPPSGAAYNVFPSASANTSSGGSLTNPALAYDVVSGTTPNDTTYADLSSGSNQNNYGEVIYSGFTGTNLTGDITIKIAPTCQVPGVVGSPTVRVQTSTDGGASYGKGTVYSSTLATQTITVPVSGVTGANIRIKVRAEAAEDWGINENLEPEFLGILQSSAKVYSVYLAVPVSGSANWSFSRRAGIGNASMWRTRAGTTYISGAQYLATVAADNGVTLTTQDVPYEAPLGKPSSGTAFLKRDSAGADTWEARRYGFPDYASGASRTVGTVYQAATDGWLSVVLSGSAANDLSVLVGATSTPATTIGRFGDDIASGTKYASMLLPIPAGTYYKAQSGASAWETITLTFFPSL